MLDLRLTTNEWDLDLASADIAVVDGPDQTVQHIRQRLQHLQEEWFLNRIEGVPWFQEILGKVNHISTVEIILKSTIIETPGVASLESFDLDADAGERTAVVRFTVKLLTGEEVSSFVGFLQ